MNWNEIYKNGLISSNCAFALAIWYWAFSFLLLKPLHNMVKVASVLAFWTPNYSLCNSLSPVDSFLLGCIFLHLLSVSIVYGNRIQANRTLRQHYHTLNAMHYLRSVVLREIMVPLQFRLLWVNVYLFRKSWVYLWGLAIRAVKSKGFGQILSFPLNLNRKAFLIENMPWNTSIGFIQQPFININKLSITRFLLRSQAAHRSRLLWKSFEIDTDKCYFFNVIGCIQIILKDYLRLLFISEQ